MKKDKEEVKKTEINKTKTKQKYKIQETKIENNYILGIIGAILGGLIASIPLILMYVYGNMMLSALAIIIGAGVFYGYKFCGGKITKGLPIIIVVISVLIVAFTTLVSIPVFFIHSEGVNINISTIKYLYEDLNFLEGISTDAITAVIFTIFGSSAIAANIRKKISNGETENIDLSNSDEIEKMKIDSINKIKPIFEKFNALEKDNGILKDELYAEINENIELKTAFNNLRSFGIVKKSKGRFYYSKELEEKQIKAKKKINSKVLTIIIGIIFIATMIGVVTYNQIKNTSPQEVSDGVISFTIDTDWNQGIRYSENEWIYYRYINNTPPEEEIKDGDYSKYPASIDIMYFENDADAVSDLESVKQIVKESIMAEEVTPETYEENIETLSNGYNVLKVRMVYKVDYESIEYIYYILKDDMIAVIDTYSYNIEDETVLKESINKIAESFKWIE